jgi:hypothetical protein
MLSAYAYRPSCEQSKQLHHIVIIEVSTTFFPPKTNKNHDIIFCVFFLNFNSLKKKVVRIHENDYDRYSN